MPLRLKSHNSSCVSLEKSASTAPARVPVARYGEPVPGDQANVAVLGISRNLTIVARGFVFWSMYDRSSRATLHSWLRSESQRPNRQLAQFYMLQLIFGLELIETGDQILQYRS